ncbi:MAG: hypothetical protein NDI82_14070 [Anaeromyxobacteraceae bacterium]|nr:hypothetical protein [Anaeromyxobacteraceae bacterium]
MTELEEGVARILDNLRRWSALPKYSVERRLDLFLAPFIPMYLGDKLGCPDEVELVVPEFPIRHGANFQTVNADYLLFRRDVPTWFLVELKTDATSVEDAQAEIYARAAESRSGLDGAPMRKLLDDLPEIRQHSRGRVLKGKYQYLVGLLEEYREFQDAPVKVVYVSPTAPRPRPWRHIRLSTLAAWKPARDQDAALWGQVAALLGQLHDGAPAKGTTVDSLGIGMGPVTVERVIRDGKDHAWSSVLVSYQAGCMPVPDARNPEAPWTVPVGRARVDRDQFLEALARQEREQWSRRD